MRGKRKILIVLFIVVVIFLTSIAFVAFLKSYIPSEEREIVTEYGDEFLIKMTEAGMHSDVKIKLYYKENNFETIYKEGIIRELILEDIEEEYMDERYKIYSYYTQIIYVYKDNAYLFSKNMSESERKSIDNDRLAQIDEVLELLQFNETETPLINSTSGVMSTPTSIKPTQTPSPTLDPSTLRWDFWLHFYPNEGIGGDTVHFTSMSEFPYEVPSHERLVGSDKGDVLKAWVSREGYAFENWNTKPDGTGKTFNPGDFIYDISEYKLYAIWEKIE